jgi:hypothetical protein
MNEVVTNYWVDHYVNQGHCSLCGNTGVIDTTGTMTPAGVNVGRRNFCICPNGQALRKHTNEPSVGAPRHVLGVLIGAGVACEDCGLLYERFPLDVVLPNDQWLTIHPDGPGGILCAQCIVKRAARLKNVTVVRAQLETT